MTNEEIIQDQSRIIKEYRETIEGLFDAWENSDRTWIMQDAFELAQSRIVKLGARNPSRGARGELVAPG